MAMLSRTAKEFDAPPPKPRRPSTRAMQLADVLCVRDYEHGYIIDRIIKANGARGTALVDAVVREVVRETWTCKTLTDAKLWPRFLELAAAHKLGGVTLV